MVVAHGASGRTATRLLLEGPTTPLGRALPAITGEAIGSGRMAPARLSLGPRATRPRVPRTPRARVLVRPTSQLVRLLELVARGALTSIGA